MMAYQLDESQVTYRVPAGLITRVNGCYNDGATTYKFISVGIWCNGNTTGFELVILGSIPSIPAKFYRSVTQWIRVLVFETRGWEFESLRAGQSMVLVV